MTVEEPGHLYSLEHFENPHGYELIQFIHKEKDEVGELVTLQDGTTNEEVLKMLIDRMEFLQKKMPCRENLLVMSFLQDALSTLEERTKDRQSRGVEGKHLP